MNWYHKFSNVQPTHLNSPTYTLAMQRGNPFDMANLLTSLLIGVDQSKTNANELQDFVPNPFKKVEVAVNTKEPVTNLKYRVKPPKQLKSQFIIKQEQKIMELKLKEEQRLRDLELNKPVEEEDDELKGLRIHAWVLVLPGKREISEAFFIEATTGKIYDCEKADYLGVESVWSATNYWVNMQICYDGLRGISFDLGDNVKWEFVLLDNAQPGMKKTKDENEEEDEDEDEDKLTEIIDLPPSWVSQLNITQEQFESKCPTGGKTVYYRNAKKEIFAEYYRTDGMTTRITFLDSDKKYPGMVLEMDKLIQRVRVNDVIHEFFKPGRSHGLKEHILINGQTKEMIFYGSARPDGLVKRVEEPRKVIYTFEDRDDRLNYRSITYDLTSDNNRTSIQKMTEKFLPSPIPSDQDIYKKTYFIKDDKIRVVFHLGPGRIVASYREFRKPAADQKGQVLDITQEFQVDPYQKPMKKQHLFSQLTDLFRTEQLFLQAIKIYERELSDILSLRGSEEKDVDLAISIYDTIRNDTVMMSVPVDDQGPENHTNGVEESQKTVEIDYLSPFLINYEDPNNLTKDEMLAAKDACLKSLRERLVEKASIIQGRLDDVQGEYQRRQLAYSRNADSMTVEETDAYVKFCNDALFRMHILEKRLAKHKDSAPERYIELDSKLRGDTRLSQAFN
ncbi:hypothetical protein BC833DRAFT_568385 [Globomyces pollinis-pini]|nr:hypothetical protein BC833DRAFT_568385 [Globomyces pollinis-pini]